MSTQRATPGEFDRLLEFLRPVPEERHQAIARMMFRELGTCPRCGEAVRASDPRRLADGRLAHLACAGSAGGGGKGASDG